MGLSCLALAGGYDLNAVQGQPYYFDFTIYNNDADPNTICDPGLYIVTLNIKNEKIEDLFEYTVTDKEVTLLDTETKKIMVSLTPKVDSGFYEVLVTVSRNEVGAESGGTKIFNSAVGKIKVNLGGETKKTVYDDVPEWYTYEQNQKAEADANVGSNLDINKQTNTEPKERGGNTALYVIIIVMAIVILFMAVMIYKKR